MDTAVKPQGCTNLKLRQLMRRVAQLYDAEVGKTGLRGTQYSLLSYAVKLGPLRPVDLARAMKVDASTLTRNLRPLIDAGLQRLQHFALARQPGVQGCLRHRRPPQESCICNGCSYNNPQWTPLSSRRAAPTSSCAS